METEALMQQIQVKGHWVFTALPLQCLCRLRTFQNKQMGKNSPPVISTLQRPQELGKEELQSLERKGEGGPQTLAAHTL
jgi:hypothetical protein